MVLPDCASLPPGILWLITSPFLTLSSSLYAIEALNPAPLRALVASASLFPTTFGTRVCLFSGPVLTRIVIVSPSLAAEPIAGIVSITLPSSTVSLAFSSTLTTNFKPSRVAIALSLVAFLISGTLLVSSPLLTVIITSSSFLISDPSAGFTSMTVSFSNSLELSDSNL